MQQRIIELCPSDDIFLLRQVQLASTFITTDVVADLCQCIRIKCENVFVKVSQGFRSKADHRVKRIALPDEKDKWNWIRLPQNFGARFSQLRAVNLRYVTMEDVRWYWTDKEALAAYACALASLPCLAEIMGWPAIQPFGDGSPQVPPLHYPPPLGLSH